MLVIISVGDYMIPIRDTVPTYTFPTANTLLIIIITIVFLITNFLPENTYYGLASKYGLVAGSFHPENILNVTKHLPTFITISSCMADGSTFSATSGPSISLETMLKIAWGLNGTSYSFYAAG